MFHIWRVYIIKVTPVTGSTMKLYNALKLIKAYILFPYRFPSALLEWSIWFNHSPKQVWWLIGLLLVAGVLPARVGNFQVDCQVDYQHLAILPHVQILICMNFTLFLEQTKHNRLFCVDTEKFESVWSRLNTAEHQNKSLVTAWHHLWLLLIYLFAFLYLSLEWTSMHSSLKFKKPDNPAWWK